MSSRFLAVVFRALVSVLILGGFSERVQAAPRDVQMRMLTPRVDVYDYAEVEIAVIEPTATNPFTDVAVTGEFGPIGETPDRIEGFCDSMEGRIFRVRFMPSRPGPHKWSITWKEGDFVHTTEGQFDALPSRTAGPVRVDREFPWHFIREGTGEHFFYNSTTAYWLLGWRDDSAIRDSLSRLARLRVNRIRVALSGRAAGASRWLEPFQQPPSEFQFQLDPWPAARPDDVANPGYDVTRFNLDHFRKAERMLKYAQEQDIVVSLVFHLDGADKGIDPFGAGRAGGADEQRYYRYVVARLAAFPNVMWDVTNEWHLFRNEAWVEKMGALITQSDPYTHATSVHGKDTFPFRKSVWCDFAMYQSWDEHGGYDFMMRQRTEQAAVGRPMPQVNEEYGYEDHYPYPWGESRRWPARATDNRRRLAWEITMAGAYQTTGERADVPGQGGWLTGRGSADMTLLEGHAILRSFFEKFPWWRLEPNPDILENETPKPPPKGTLEVKPAPLPALRSAPMCLAEKGVRYVVYMPRGGRIVLTMAPGKYVIRWFNPRSGEFLRQIESEGGEWTSPRSPDAEDWVLLAEAAE